METQNQSDGGSASNSTALFADSDIKQIIYEHGGCRIYAEVNGKRDLIADGYQDEKFAEALGQFVRDYFANA